MKKRRLSNVFISLIGVFILLVIPVQKNTQAITDPVPFHLISSMEEDWFNCYPLGDFRYDYSDAVEGDGCLVLMPDSVEGFVGVKTSFYPMNLSLHGFRFFMQSTDWDLVYTLVITFHTYGDWGDYYSLDMVWNLIEKPDNEWIEVVLSPSEFEIIGNPSWQSINMVSFRTDVNPGKNCEIMIDGLDSFYNRQEPAISIVFDDGFQSVMKAKTVMNEFGVAGTLFIIPDYLEEPEFVDQNMIDSFHEDGWDIGGHGMTPLTELTQDELHEEFRSTKQYLEAHQYRGKDLYALPYGVYNQQILSIGSQYFSWIRPSDSLNQPSGYIPAGRMNARSVIVNTPVDTIKVWIDRAKEYNDWVVLVFHRIEEDPVYDTDYRESSFREIIQYAVDCDVPIMPMSAFLEAGTQS